MQQPSKRAYTLLSRAPAYATRKHAPGDTMADRPKRREEMIGADNVELSILRARHPELIPQVIADHCEVSLNIARHWTGKGGRRLPMPRAMFEKLLLSIEKVLT